MLILKTCTFVNASHHVVGLFRPEDLADMYKLNPPEISLNKPFLEIFKVKELKAQKLDMVDLVKEWSYDLYHSK